MKEKKQKINFKQPKYILPLILLPFIFFFMFLINQHKSKNKVAEEVELQKSAGYNISIPDPHQEEEIDNKLDNVKRYFNDEKSSKKTFMTELGQDEIDDGIVVDLLTPEEKMKADSLMKARDNSKNFLDDHKKMIDKMINQTLPEADHVKDLESIISNQTPEASVIIEDEFLSVEKKENNPKQEKSQMDEFKEQMQYLDSLQFPEKYAKKEEIKKEEIDYAELNTGEKQSSHFNTISNQNKPKSIKALLDEGIIVYGGSRVRLRLMNDVYLDDLFLKKGTYLYGVVKAFKNQRVLVRIPSILINGEIVQTNISLYDLDGLEGLFVPNSAFREFVNELGGSTSSTTGGTSINNNNAQQDLSQQFLFETATNTIKVTTKALERAIKKNKARFKYNSQVILQNKK